MDPRALFSDLEKRYGLPSGYLARTWQLESGSGRDTYNEKSGAAGSFQFMPRTAAQYGLTDPYDLAASADAAARFARDNAGYLRSKLGRDVDAADLYIAHQQGAGGAFKLLSGQGSAGEAVGNKAVSWNAGNPNAPASEFVSLWRSKFEGAPAQAAPQAQAQPAATPSQPQPVYGNDLVTGLRRVGNYIAPELVEAPQPMTQEQITAAREQDRQMGLLSNAQKGFGALAALGAAPRQQQEEMVMPAAPQRQVQFTPIQRYRALQQIRGLLG